MPTRNPGYVDKKGRLVIPLRREWQDWAPFSQGLAAVQIDGKYGFINNRGRMVIAPRFDPAMVFKFMGVHGEYEAIDPIVFAENLAAVKFDGKAGYIDHSGRFAIAPRFEAALPFTEKLGRVRLDGKWGFVDAKGNIVIKPRFEFVGEFSDGLAQFKAGDRIGFIDKTGTEILPAIYWSAAPFRGGLAFVCQSRVNCRYIDKAGKKIADSIGE